jgi:hypothetical protein
MMTTRPHVVMDYFNISTALDDREKHNSNGAGVTAARIDLTLSGNDLLMDTLAVMQRVFAAHAQSLELVLIKSRAVHELAMRLHAAPRALQVGTHIRIHTLSHTPSLSRSGRCRSARAHTHTGRCRSAHTYAYTHFHTLPPSVAQGAAGRRARAHTHTHRALQVGTYTHTHHTHAHTYTHSGRCRLARKFSPTDRSTRPPFSARYARQKGALQESRITLKKAL